MPSQSGHNLHIAQLPVASTVKHCLRLAASREITQRVATAGCVGKQLVQVSVLHALVTGTAQQAWGNV